MYANARSLLGHHLRQRKNLSVFKESNGSIWQWQQHCFVFIGHSFPILCAKVSGLHVSPNHEFPSDNLLILSICSPLRTQLTAKDCSEERGPLGSFCFSMLSVHFARSSGQKSLWLLGWSDLVRLASELPGKFRL